ncbi:DUF1289 domain-containing protein [Azonexus sp.]|uniref:DUF1289 domain-containing protein n=1 Tax=Azonexus sp. TaxID=1872668 RepID=UPI0035B44FA2
MSASPCINVCRMDPASGLCRGCLRTLDEIAGWSAMDPAARAATLATVAERRARPENAEKRDV